MTVPELLEKYYVEHRTLDDDRIIGVMRLLFHWTLHIDINEIGYEDRYCYPRLDECLAACRTWDGIGDPPGFWNRHPISGRRRDEAGKEWIEF
jgi:hypothetical protein